MGVDANFVPSLKVTPVPVIVIAIINYPGGPGAPVGPVGPVGPGLAAPFFTY